MQQSNNSPAASEKVLQTHVVAALMKMVRDGLPILFAGDMAGNRRTRSESLWAKNTGLVAGEPDLRVYGPGGRILLIELKTTTGDVSVRQRARHAALRRLGHDVRILRARTGPEAAATATKMVGEWISE